MDGLTFFRIHQKTIANKYKVSCTVQQIGVFKARSNNIDIAATVLTRAEELACELKAGLDG
jgi:hypothetical protein